MGKSLISGRLRGFGWSNWPLAIQLTLLMTAMVVVVAASITLLSVHSEQQRFRAELQQQATLLLDTLEIAISDPLFELDSGTLSDIVEGLGQNRELVTFGRVYDSEGRILADAYDQTLTYNFESDPFGQQLVESDTSVFEWQSDQLVAGKAIHVGAEILGAICVGLPTDPLRVKLTMMRNQGIGTALTSILVGILLALLISRSMTKPLQELVKATEQIAEGDLSESITRQSSKTKRTSISVPRGSSGKTSRSSNEIVSLSYSFATMARYLGDMATVADNISHGEVIQAITPRSERDMLGQAFHRMSGYLQETISVAETIAVGDLHVKVTPQSEQDLLTMSLQRMVANLQQARQQADESMQKVERQNWLKTGRTELNDALRGEQDLTTLGQNIISYLATYLQAQVGAFYLVTGDQTLSLRGRYAYPAQETQPGPLKFGESLVGQSAMEKQAILVSDVPEDYLAIPLGLALGEAPPRHLLLQPFLYEGQVKGVLELGTIHAFTELQQNFLEQAAESIAIVIHSAQVREEIQQLLERTQQQAEELQSQQEELQVSNEELAGQAKALQTSEQQLQGQQEELRQSNEELEEQRQALQHQNIELEQARQLLEEKAKDLELANKYKSEFLANMSHELRTPLNSLLILSRLLYENTQETLTDKEIEYARTIHSSGSELLTLINDILDLSKVEAGKMVLNLEAMSFKGLSTYIEQNFCHLAEEKDLFLKISCAEDVPESIFTDRQRVEQIVKNLLSNSMKFTENGGININISRPVVGIDLTRSDVNPQKAVAIAISDTGIGIPEERQRLIFEAFQQVDGSTSRKYGGTGLGLSITREFVKLLGGEIHLESQEGQGSTFTLYLPEALNKSAAETDQKSEEAQNSEQHVATSESHMVTVDQSGVGAIRDDRHEPPSEDDKFLLIIDDDPKFAKVLFDLAREKGFKGLIAGDGAAGLQLADQYRPSSIILDIGLPDIDGWQVMEKLKANPNTCRIPVHFITAQDDASDAMKMGAIGYLMKPASMEGLCDVFHKIERVISQPIKKLLVVGDDETRQTNLYDLLTETRAFITTVTSEKAAYNRLQTEKFDCMMLDLELANGSPDRLLERLNQDANMSVLPIIVYTENTLTKEEELLFSKYAESIIVKGTKSPERLLDEIELFLHRVEVDLSGKQQKKVRMLHDKELVLDGKRLLMVDDDIRNLFALSSVLEEKGMSVLVARNGKEALGQLEQESAIDVVLMDIMMPEMDGYEAMRQIRAQGIFKDLPIIALTAKAMKGDRQKCIDAGANDYLSKPVDIDKLLSLLRVWLY